VDRTHPDLPAALAVGLTPRGLSAVSAVDRTHLDRSAVSAGGRTPRVRPVASADDGTVRVCSASAASRQRCSPSPRFCDPPQCPAGGAGPVYQPTVPR